MGGCRAVICDGAKVSTETVDHSPEKTAAEKHRLQSLGVNIDGGYVDEKSVDIAPVDVNCQPRGFGGDASCFSRSPRHSETLSGTWRSASMAAALDGQVMPRPGLRPFGNSKIAGLICKPDVTC